MSTAWSGRRGTLALLLSLALHGAFLVIAGLRVSGTPQWRPVPIASVVLEEGTLLFDDRPSPKKDAKGTPEPVPGASEESAPFTARVVDIPLPRPEPGVAESPTVVIGSLPGSSNNAGASEGMAPAGAMGLLRAPAKARRIVYVMDRSVSMGLGSNALEAARIEVLASLAALTSETSFQVVLYNRQAELLALDGGKTLVSATPEVRAATARLLAQVRAEGGTDHLVALRLALSLDPDTIYLLTDADDLTPAQVRTITAWNRGRAALHAVELRDGPLPSKDAPLAQLTRLTGGSHRVAPVRRGQVRADVGLPPG